MTVSGINDNSFCESLLRESDITLLRAISTEHATEKTRKHTCQILRS